MKKVSFFVLMLIVPVFLAQCASLHKWPDYERTAEDRMTVIQQKIGEGLKTSALTPGESEMLLARLENIRRDYLALRDENVYRGDWERLLRRIDLLEDEVNKALAFPPRAEGSVIEDRLITLQGRIDDARINGRLNQTKAEEFQGRLDAIRSDYLRMAEDGRFVSSEDKAEISRRLDLLEADLTRYP